MSDLLFALFQVDSIAVVTAPYEVQRGRVLARPDMTTGLDLEQPVQCIEHSIFL